MGVYKCFRCGYIASQRINMKHHLNRKNICNPILDNISIDEMKMYYKLNESILRVVYLKKLILNL